MHKHEAQRLNLVDIAGIVCIVLLCLLLLEGCSEVSVMPLDNNGKHDAVRELRVRGGDYPDSQWVWWHTTGFECPSARKTGTLPKITILKKNVHDEFQKQYDFDRVECVPAKFGEHGGYEIAFYLRQDKISKKAKELQFEMLISADGLKFHLKDRVLKNKHPKYKWMSDKFLPEEKKADTKE